MINAGAHRFAAPAAVVQLRRQAVGIGDSHRRHTARSRPGAVGVAASPSGAAARGSLKRAESIVGARQVNLADQVAVTAAVREQFRYRGGVGRAFLPARGSADRVGQFLRGILVRFLTGAPSPFV